MIHSGVRILGPNARSLFLEHSLLALEEVLVAKSYDLVVSDEYPIPDTHPAQPKDKPWYHQHKRSKY